MAEPSKIRVMIVDDIADTREYIRRSLQFDNLIEVVGLARNGNEAIQMTMEQKPDVIIMDINMPDMDGITATEAVRRKSPSTQVIILSVQNDPSYMRRAMLVGARDFLTKPPSIDELLAAIRRAGKMAEEEKNKLTQQASAVQTASQNAVKASSSQGKVVVVYSPKGGTGRTTISVNLALALASDDKKIVLVDGAMQFGDVAIFLNETSKNSIVDLAIRADELDIDVVEDVISKHNATGLHILPAPSKPESAEKVNGEQFGKVLKFLRDHFNYIVVDTASYLTEFVQVALGAADIIVLITTQDIPSIKNISLFLSLADASGISRQKIVFIMNKFDRRYTTLTPERIGENLKQEVVLSIPLDEKVVVSAANKGVPFYFENKTFPISRSIASLAEMVKDRIQKLDVPPV